MFKNFAIFVSLTFFLIGLSYDVCFSANLIFSDSFEDGNLSPWQSVSSDSVISAPSFARTGSYVKKTDYAKLAGTSDGGGAFVNIKNYNSSEFYASAYWMYDNSYPTRASGSGWKIARFYSEKACGGKYCLQWEQYFNGDNGLGSFTFNPYGIGDGAKLVSYKAVPSGTHTKGQWNRYEIYVKKNSSISSSDGTVRIWITPYNGNRKLVVEETNQKICITEDCLGSYFQRIAFPSNVGTAQAGMYIYWDDIEFWDGMPSSSTSTSAVSNNNSPPPPPGKPYPIE